MRVGRMGISLLLAGLTAVMLGAPGSAASGLGSIVKLPRAAAEPGGASAEPVTSCDAPTTFLINPSFETPTVTEFATFPQSQVTGWSTTDPSGGIEIWNQTYAGFPAPDGQQWTELNATAAATVYQDVATVPGESISYLVYHRSRVGENTAEIRIGAPDAAPDTVVEMVADTSAWVPHVGTYVVPAGQTTTRFAFAAITGEGPGGSEGNFFDGLQFGSAACGEVALTASDVNGGDLAPGDVVEYTATVRNAGGFAMADPVVNLPIPAGAVYVAESLRVLDGLAAGPVTDVADGDAGTGPGPSGEPATIAVGGPAFGLLLAGDSRSVSYQVRVVDPAAVTSVDNQVSLTYRAVGEDVTAISWSAAVSLPVVVPPSTPTPTATPSAEPTSTVVPAPSATATPTGGSTAATGPTPSGSSGGLAASGLDVPGLVVAAALVLGGGLTLTAARRRRADDPVR